MTAREFMEKHGPAPKKGEAADVQTTSSKKTVMPDERHRVHGPGCPHPETVDRTQLFSELFESFVAGTTIEVCKQCRGLLCTPPPKKTEAKAE